MSSDPIQYGEVKSSYFWDDGSGINGDTGAPASGEPMQEGMAASPSWPLGTEGYVIHDGQKADFFVGDRGPGDPAENCDVLLDLDAKTFAELTGGSFDEESLTVSGGEGHIDVEYVITEWGDGAGNEGAPHPMSESETCNDAVSPVPDKLKPEAQKEEQEKKEQESAEKKEAEAKKEQEAADKNEAEEQQAQVEEENGQAKTEQADSMLAAHGDDGASGGAGQGTSTGTEAAANDMSGLDLAGADAPIAAGALTLALLPALLIAFLVARRPQVSYAQAAEEGENGPLARLGDKIAETRDAIAERWNGTGRHHS